MDNPTEDNYKPTAAITKVFGTIGAKMTWAFVLVASVVVISTIITIWQVNQIARTTDVVREQRQPTTDSCVTLLYGINASLAELRAWILLGKPEFKQQRAKTWDETIQTSLTRLEELSVAWPDPSDAKRLRNVNQRIEQLRAYQDQIEALAHTPDNQPALKILFDEAIPRAATITDRITEIINIEKSQEANSARKLLLAYMADFRGSMALSLANIRAYQLSAEDQFQRLFETQWEKNEAAFVALDENRQSLTIEQVKAFDSLMHARSEFIPLPERMFQLRSADDWNRANYLLATKAAPTADEIRTLLDDMVDHQRQLMDDAQETASKQFVTLRGIQWLTVAFGLATCLILGLSLTRATAGPINQAVEMAKNMAEGNLDFRAEIQGTVEAETLGQSLDHMAGNLAALIQQIERQERQMRLVVEGSPSGMVMVDGEGTIVLVNARMEETFGYKRDELIGQPVDLFLPTQMRPQHVRDRTEFMRNPRVYEMGQGRDLYAVHKSGRQIPVEVGLTPVETESGMCVLATVVDISERKRAEEEAKKQTEMIAAAERQMRLVVEGSPSGMVMVDGEGAIVLVNARMEETFGYKREELIGQPVDLFLPTQMRPQHVRDRTEFMRNPRVYEMGQGRDLFAVHKSGRQIPVEVGLTPVETESGMCVLATVVDISERKRAEEEAKKQTEMIAAAERQMRHVFEASTSGMVMVDERGTIILVNERMEQTFGYSRDELIGQPVEIFLPAEMHPQHVRDRAEFMHSPRVYEMGRGRDLYAVHKSGQQIPVEVGLTPVETDSGMCVLATVIDITERKLAQDELEQTNDALRRSNEELEQFAYIASHDLQEPLRKISSFCGVLNEDYGDQFDEEGERYLGYVIDGAGRMRTLIQDLLSFSRVQTQGDKFTEVDTSKSLETALGNLEMAIEESNAKITNDDLPTIIVDKTQFSQLLQNLIGNAIKYRSEAPPEVHVGVENCDKEWLFSISDNGIGIDPEFHQRVFGIFKRLHNRGSYSGTGIGLAICRRIVERRGGRIWVESAENEGSKFFFTVPKKHQQGEQR